MEQQKQQPDPIHLATAAAQQGIAVNWMEEAHKQNNLQTGRIKQLLEKVANLEALAAHVGKKPKPKKPATAPRGRRKG